MSPVTVTDLVQNFADACRALVPALDRANVPWRDNEQYDNWDRVVEPLFETLVTEPCTFAAVGEPGLIRLQVVPYGSREHDPKCNAYVALDDPSPKRLVGLYSNVLPFDEVVFCECNGSAMGTLALRDARFVFVFAGFEGADQQLTIVPLDAL
jgi:hypothetical protein